MRVRLIRPLLIELKQLDTTATRAVGGYDDDFGSTKVAILGGRRIDSRQEKGSVRLLGQVEDQVWNGLRSLNAGNSPEAKMAIAFDYHELECRKLIDPLTKQPLINVNDRLVAMYSPDGCELVLKVRPPGLYAVEVRPAAISLHGRPGIVVVRFNDRQLSQEPG